jgi:hypothetical protein
MPAVSQSQQHFMGMVHAYKKGELTLSELPKSLQKRIKKAAKSMTGEEVNKFASTKTKGLPKKKKTNEALDTSFKKFLVEEETKKPSATELVTQMRREAQTATDSEDPKKRAAGTKYLAKIADAIKTAGGSAVKALEQGIKARDAYHYSVKEGVSFDEAYALFETKHMLQKYPVKDMKFDTKSQNVVVPKGGYGAKKGHTSKIGGAPKSGKTSMTNSKYLMEPAKFDDEDLADHTGDKPEKKNVSKKGMVPSKGKMHNEAVKITKPHVTKNVPIKDGTMACDTGDKPEKKNVSKKGMVPSKGKMHNEGISFEELEFLKLFEEVEIPSGASADKIKSMIQAGLRAKEIAAKLKNKTNRDKRQDEIEANLKQLRSAFAAAHKNEKKKVSESVKQTKPHVTQKTSIKGPQVEPTKGRNIKEPKKAIVPSKGKMARVSEGPNFERMTDIELDYIVDRAVKTAGGSVMEQDDEHNYQFGTKNTNPNQYSGIINHITIVRDGGVVHDGNYKGMDDLTQKVIAEFPEHNAAFLKKFENKSGVYVMFDEWAYGIAGERALLPQVVQARTKSLQGD